METGLVRLVRSLNTDFVFNLLQTFLIEDTMEPAKKSQDKGENPKASKTSPPVKLSINTAVGPYHRRECTGVPPETHQVITEQDTTPDNVQRGFHHLLVHRPPSLKPPFAQFGGAWKMSDSEIPDDRNKDKEIGEANK